MTSSILNPIQAEEVDGRVDKKPKWYDPNDVGCQSLHFPDSASIPVLYEVMLPYIPICHPTKEEFHHYQQLEMISQIPWHTFFLIRGFCLLSSGFELIDIIEVVDQLDAYDRIAYMLLSTQLSNLFSIQSIITYVDGIDKFQYISAINSKLQYIITTEELSSLLCIGLNTYSCTFKATTHKYFFTIGFLTKRFRTDKYRLHYKELSPNYGTFYNDFLKVQDMSIRGYCGGLLYTNNTGFKNFFPCESDKGKENDQSLRSFIELVGLPYSLYSDYHNNFKESLFRQLLQKFGIYQTFTEPNPPWKNRPKAALG